MRIFPSANHPPRISRFTIPQAVRALNPSSKGSELSAITVIEIENDDMPFLLDSVTGDLSELHLDIRLAVHPIFALTRKEKGALEEWRGLAKDGKKKHRESFIHIHTDRIDESRHVAIANALRQTRECVAADARRCPYLRRRLAGHARLCR